MLKIAILLAIASVSQPDTTRAVEVMPKMPDWRSEFTISALHSRLSLEWTCAKDDPGSSLVIEMRDTRRGNTRNAYYAVSLIDLRVHGRKATIKTKNQVQAALAEINKSPILEGHCRDTVPALFISGHYFDGKQYTPKKYYIDLP